MRRMTRWMMVFSACLAMTALAGPARSEDKKPAAKPLDRHSLDEAIYARLREVIDHGANLYNQGDWNGCYRLYEGALMSVRSQVGDRSIRSWAKAVDGDALKGLQSRLGDHPSLKDVIETGIANARQTPELYRRAFVLRVVLDQIRAETRPAKSATPSDAAEANKALWDRLGGEAGVTRIIDDFINLAAADPKVDFFRHNKVQLDAEQIVTMKRQFVEQISQATGGPLKYTGPDLKKIHKGMGISEAQFNAAAADLKKALEKNKVAVEDVKIILDAVGRFRKEIVEPKKTEEKKPGAPASVRGRVTYKGQPAAGAKISLVAGDGKAVSDTVAADGSYQLRLTSGEYTITISGPAKLGLPVKFAGVNTSGLKLNVIGGKQNHDINLQE